MSGETNVGEEGGDQQGLLNTMTSITRQRVKLNIKVLGVQLGSSQDGQGGGGGGGGGGGKEVGGGGSSQERQSYREQFMAPEMSIVSKLMSKVGDCHVHSLGFGGRTTGTRIIVDHSL